MFSVVLVIDCDECRHAFSRAAVFRARDLSHWQKVFADTKDEARFQGWYITENGCLCESCAEEECHHAKRMEENFRDFE
jgi:hypothetical protein